jgi:hypothetical protein
VIGGIWGYNAYQTSVIAGKFSSNHYQTHIVQRVSEETKSEGFLGLGSKVERIILMDNGDIVRESQFTDNAGALTRVGDALDIVYGQDGKIEGVRRTTFSNVNNTP